MEGSRPRGRPKRTWKEVVQKDCQARNLNKEDAMDRGRWKKLTYSPGSSQTKGHKTVVVVVLYDLSIQ